MPIQQRFCENHPERPAIGLCVMTRKPICGECSTKYEGVNYSREGLRLLHEQRAAALATSRKPIATTVIAWLFSPLVLYLMYIGYVATANLLMGMLHWEL